MNQSLIAERYAGALFELAREKNSLERVYADITELHETIRQTRVMKIFLRAPIVNPGKKKVVMKSIFGDRFDTLTMSFLSLLLSKRRESLIPDIALQFIQQYKQSKGILTVHLKTASGTDEKIRSRVKDMMLRHTHSLHIELVEETDPDLIGGFVLSWDDFQYDASVKKQLERLKRGVARVNLYVKGF